MEKLESILSLVRSIEGTTRAVGVKPEMTSVAGQPDTIAVKDENGIDAVDYSGDNGRVRLEFNGTALTVLCGKEDGELKEVDNELFEYGADDWNVKEIRSASNEVVEQIAKYFGIVPVYDTEAQGRSGKKASGKSQKAPDAEPVTVSAGAAKQEIKKAKQTAESYEPIHLALRMEAIYPELKGKAEENIKKYGEFLPEEYFKTEATKYILGSIRTENRSELKRLFKTFNLFYDEGEKDCQSLIVVSILGLGINAEPGLKETADSWMSETLRPAVDTVVKYLGKPAGKRQVEKLENPKPYKPTLKERMKKSSKRALLGQ